MSFFVYIIYSPGKDKYYVGQTHDFNSRLLRHNGGHVRSTAPYRPWELALLIEKANKTESLRLESKLKNLNKTRLKVFIEKYRN